MSTVISHNLKYYRKLRQFTQQELATSLFVTPQAVSKWERGESLPDISLIPQISHVLNISIVDLWDEECHRANKQENAELVAFLRKVDEMETLEEFMLNFDFFILLRESQKEKVILKLLTLSESDFVIEDFYYYLPSALKEKIVLLLLKESRYQALETLIPMMSSKMRTRVLEECLKDEAFEFLDELFPFLTYNQKNKLIEKVRNQQLSVTHLENYLTFFTDQQRIFLKEYEED